MNVAILCPGKSLVRFNGSEMFDLVIGVNRAGIKHECGVWACGDDKAVFKSQKKVLGAPKLFTSEHAAGEIIKAGTPWLYGVETFESLYDGSQERLQWFIYTATAALWFAGRNMRGGMIKAFGMDWEGEEDWDGELAGGNRSTDRWAHERAIWRNVANELGGRGVAVERVR